jgi:CBS domain-containing protein
MDFGNRGYGYDFRDRPWSGRGYGGMRSDNVATDWHDFPGESGWLGEGYAGYPNLGYDFDYQGGMRSPMERGGFAGDRYDRMMRGTGYGHTGRDTGYGGGMYDRGYGQGMGRSGPGTWNSSSGSRTRAAEIMTDNPECVTADTSLADVAKKMKELNVGIIPVVDSAKGRHLKGVITDRDIAIRAVAEGKDGKATVGDCMTTDVETVNKNDSVDRVLDLMGSEQVRRVPVTDREGRVVGIIAQADLAVEYGGHRTGRERKVEDTVERISEPARPRRSGGLGSRQQQPTMQAQGKG